MRAFFWLVMLPLALLGCADPGNCPKGTEWSGIECVRDEPWEKLP